MATIKVLAGDLSTGSWDYMSMFGSALMKQLNSWGGITIDFKREVASVELLTENNVQKFSSSAAWGGSWCCSVWAIGCNWRDYFGWQQKGGCFCLLP